MHHYQRRATLAKLLKQVCKLSSALIVLSAWSLAAGNQVKQTIFVEGSPAKHAAVSLYKSKDSSLYKGPLTTADDGSVTFSDVDDGNYTVRVEIAAGYGSQQVHIDASTKEQRVDINEVLPALRLADRVVAVSLCVFTVLIVIYPIGRFLAKPWAFRRDALTGQLAGSSMKLYYERFRRGEVITKLDNDGKPTKQKLVVGDAALTSADYEAAFDIHFDRWYGRRYYIAPVFGLLVLTAICAWWGCTNLWLWISGLKSIESMRGLVAAALAGALVWIVSDEIDRLRRRDFTSSDVYYYVFRILLSIPFAWALTRAQVTLQLGIPTAFFLGSFPTSTLFTAARRFANQQLKLGEDPVSGNLELEKLQNVGKENAERFKDEGISTICQLAYADPVDLTIRTNFDFNYVTDSVSQALLWLYLGDQLSNAAIYSLRGAYEAHALMEGLKNNDPIAQKTLTDVTARLVANKVQISEDTLRATLRQAGYDPFTIFLVDIWN